MVTIFPAILFHIRHLHIKLSLLAPAAELAPANLVRVFYPCAPQHAAQTGCVRVWWVPVWSSFV